MAALFPSANRECSVPRRHQKVMKKLHLIVHARPPQEMGDAAVRLARAGRYVNAGTVESRRRPTHFYSSKSTRVQVEHPVTEQVTGLDLVKLQIAIRPATASPSHGKPSPHAATPLEVRLMPRIPDNNFFPFARKKFFPVARPAVPPFARRRRLRGWTVPNEYDPSQQLIAWGNSREKTIARLRALLTNTP